MSVYVTSFAAGFDIICYPQILVSIKIKVERARVAKKNTPQDAPFPCWHFPWAYGSFNIEYENGAEKFVNGYVTYTMDYSDYYQSANSSVAIWHGDISDASNLCPYWFIGFADQRYVRFVGVGDCQAWRSCYQG